MDNLNSEGGIESQSAAAKGAALLLIIGEPFSEEHKKLILGEVSKGFRCWDVEETGVDLNDELANIANKADLGEEGPNGERIIRHNSEYLTAEVLVNPQAQTVSAGVKNFLTSPCKHKHLIYAGHAFQGSGAWILQDDTFTFNNFAHAFKDQDVGNAVRQQQGGSLVIYTGSEGDWTNGHITKNEFSKLLDVKLNPAEKLDSMHGVLQFTAYLSNFVRVRQLNELMQSSDVVGNIRFSRPTLYIFPGCQGDSALFGISGFNLLVNGGYSRKACFWDFTRHLDRIDAALMTHLGTDNLFGFQSVLQRKSIEIVHPEIGFMYVNASDKIKALPSTESSPKAEENLHVNLAEEGNKLIQYAKQIGPIPQSCSRNQTGNTIEPINLYHKVGIGALDMYILNPITDSKEMKEFYQQWNQNVAQFGTSQHMPLPNTLSVCALLVWQPSDPNDNITRIFFPGNAPQHKVLEGLEKLKSLDILKHAKCTKASLTAKPAARKPASSSARSQASTKSSPASTPRNEAPKKEIKEVATARSSASKTRAAPPLSTQKVKKEKEDVNKKTMKAPERLIKTEKPSRLDKVGKVEKKTEKIDRNIKSEKLDKSKAEKSDKPKKVGSPQKSSAKSSASSSPKEVKSPIKDAKKEKAPKVKETAPAVVPDILDTAPPSEPIPPVTNGAQESSVDPPGFSSEPLEPERAPVAEQPQSLIDISPEPAPEQAEPPVTTGGLDKQKMLELGIYDEDQDIEEDLNAQKAQEPAETSAERVPQMFGGMADSMHEDLMGDTAGQNAMQGSFHGDLMSGSFHEAMYANKSPFEGQFNGAIEELTTPEDSTSEEIQPQALPEPVAYPPESYGQEPDVIPVVSAKEEPQPISEPEASPVAPEPDLLPVKQEESPVIDEDSTLPVEDKVEATPMLETPEEVENNLPEDVQEKDLSEETEKDINGEMGMKETDVDLIEPFAKEEALPVQQEVPTEIAPTEMAPTEIASKEPEYSDLDEEVSSKPFEQPEEIEPVQDKPMESMPEPEEQAPVETDVDYMKTEDQEQNVQDVDNIKTEDQEQKDQDVDFIKTEDQEQKVQDELEQQIQEPLEDRSVPEFSPEPELLAQENEPELDTVPSESPDVPDIIERPESPEPDQLEQEKIIGESIRESDLMSRPIMTGNDIIQPPGDFDKFEQENAEAPESEEERADSPDSQLGAQDVNRDSLERDEVKEASPFSSEGQRDSIEREVEDAVEQVAVSTPEERDSIERSVSPDEGLAEKPVEGKEDSVERSPSPLEEKEPSHERSVSPGNEQEQRESTEKSFEDDSDESDEDDEDDDESSSFEQEEATDEKCLIQDSVTEDQKVPVNGVKMMETDSLIAPTDSLASDNILTPESEYTDASHGGQVGYHEIDDQEGDSDGLEDKDALASVPHQQTQPFGHDYEQFGGQHFGTGPMGNPFEMPEQPKTNPFTGYDEQAYEPEESSSQEENFGPSGGPAGFDPLAEWGQPMGLPSPAPPEEKNAAKTGAKKAPASTKKPETKRPTSATKKPAPKPAASNGVPDKAKNRLSMGGAGTNLNSSRLSTGGKTGPKPRPATAPANGDVKKMNGTKRPATATGARSSPAAIKMPPLPPFHPFYVDLTYIPNHGNSGYSDVEYFKRVRARYYVLSSLSPNTQTLDALIEGKKTWEDKSLQVTVIPTYDNETLRLWMSLHKDKLAEEKVEIAPSANRCTIQLQDHETSSSAYRLEF